MANSSEPLVRSIHGTNPENLVEKIVRYKIHQSTYWKQQCFGLTAETLVDKAMELDHTGGTHSGNRKPTPFLCLALKMLEIQPEKDIVVEFIKNDDHKYLRLLGAFYLRLTGTNTDVYQYLEPLYNDYRKIRQKLDDGTFTLTHVDEFIDELLTKDYCCDTALPRIQKRWVLEACESLGPRISVLEDDFEEDEEDTKEVVQPMDLDMPCTPEKKDCRRRSPAKGRDTKHERHQRDRDHHRDRGYDMNYDRGRQRYISGGRNRVGDKDSRCYRTRDDDYRHDRERDRKRERDHEDDEHCRRRGRGNACPRGGFKDDFPMEVPNKRKENKEKKNNENGSNPNDPEIIATNKLRASIGLEPLR